VKCVVWKDLFMSKDTYSNKDYTEFLHSNIFREFINLRAKHGNVLAWWEEVSLVYKVGSNLMMMLVLVPIWTTNNCNVSPLYTIYRLLLYTFVSFPLVPIWTTILLCTLGFHCTHWYSIFETNVYNESCFLLYTLLLDFRN
jgi:hypothetical protein